MAETFSLMTAPKQEHLANLIRINRAIAAGLGNKADKRQSQQAARFADHLDDGRSAIRLPR